MKKMIYQDKDIDYEEFEDCDSCYEMLHDEFEDIFNKDYNGNRYVVQGVLGLWDGLHDAYSDKVYDSIYDAICDISEDYIEVFEEKYGNLKVNSYHHDGVNRLEIKEVTKKGEDLIDNWFTGNLCKVKGATRNVRFIKNYL